MADQAHEWTDEEIERLERRFRRQYNQASREMRKRLDDMMESYDKANAEWKQRVKSGDATQEDYDGWLKDQATDRAFVQSMAQTLAQDANRTNQLAMDTVNDAIPSVFAENANYAAFEVEHGIGYETHAFDLYDQSTVRRLIRDQPDLLPPLPNPRMDNGRDLRWNRQRFAGVITQSVLQGESIPKTADRIGRVMRTNEAAATRAARTALTGAENAGRVDSYKRAQNIGIELEQEWLATHDERTRITHRLLDGEHVPVGERFVPDGYGDKYSIGFPGDPTALGEMVYNCRCTLVAWLPSIAKEDNRSWAKMPDGMTYDEWKHGKKQEKEKSDAESKPATPETNGHGLHPSAEKLFGGKVDIDKATTAISDWKDGEAYDIRWAQQSGFKTKKGEYLEDLIEHCEIPFDSSSGPIWRGICVDDAQYRKFMSMAEEEETPILDMLGTSSWTSDRDIAMDFAKNAAEIGGLELGDASRQVVFELSGLSADSHLAMDIEAVGGELGQSEIILSRKARLIPTWMEERDGVLYIEVEPY